MLFRVFWSLRRERQRNAHQRLLLHNDYLASCALGGLLRQTLVSIESLPTETSSDDSFTIPCTEEGNVGLECSHWELWDDYTTTLDNLRSRATLALRNLDMALEKCRFPIQGETVSLSVKLSDVDGHVLLKGTQPFVVGADNNWTGSRMSMAISTVITSMNFCELVAFQPIDGRLSRVVGHFQHAPLVLYCKPFVTSATTLTLR